MIRTASTLLALLALPATAAAPVRTPAEIVAAASPSAWQAIPPEDLVVMDLADGRQVVIQLAPDFAPVHVANIRALVRAGWFDANAVVRVQDNYVVQWGGADEKRALPGGIDLHPPAEYERPAAGFDIEPLPARDSYAPRTGLAKGWPVAADGQHVWLTHCYGMVGVGRDMPPDTGAGQELYTVIGQAPRQLDRNIALVGRVIDGMDALTALPRGTGALGFYTDPKQFVPIRRARVAADVPTAERIGYQAMRTASPDFAAYLAARVNRRDPFFIRPAGAIDICNVSLPVRRMP
jgi:peptidylprolyl isomerase